MCIEKTITVSDAVAITAGVVIGAGIFRTPPLVALALPDSRAVLLLWFAGGAATFAGALCYAELASAYPDPGGEYRYLVRAYGRSTGFLYAWVRMTVIQPGTIAMIAYLIGDYASIIFRLPGDSAAKYAWMAVIAGTGAGMMGIRFGKHVQRGLVFALMTGLAVIIITGFRETPPHDATVRIGILTPGLMGRALIFVLLTYSGWNEGVTLSSELRGSGREMLRVLLLSAGLITLAYTLMNAALLHGLGFAGVSGSGAAAEDLMRISFGESGATLIGLLIIIASYSTMNAMILTGARTSYALGKDFPMFSLLGKWNTRRGTPTNALAVQGFIALFLVTLGTEFRNGVVSVIEYTAPVFWLFLMLGGASLMVLRFREPNTVRPFRTPLYPFTPLLFCVSCAYLVQASTVYSGWGALAGVAVLVAGIPFLVRGPAHGKEIGMHRSNER